MRKVLSTFAILIILYLVLIHFTGFSKDVSTLSKGGVELTKAFQGR
jgi:hypothetical protein